GDGGTQLRRRQATPRTPLCEDARTGESATAVPAGGHRAEHQEDRPGAHQKSQKYSFFGSPHRLADMAQTMASSRRTTTKRLPLRLIANNKNKPHQKRWGSSAV